MKRVVFQLILLLIPLCTTAQGNLPLLRLPIIELLQYQVQKGKRRVVPYLFSKYGLRQIPVDLVTDSTQQLWGWHVTPNMDFEPSKQAFYRIFAKKDNSSLAIVDNCAGVMQIVFWNKEYYHVFTTELFSHGYQLQQMKPASNILRFQRENSSVIADVTIWADMYVLEFHN